MLELLWTMIISPMLAGFVGGLIGGFIGAWLHRRRQARLWGGL